MVWHDVVITKHPTYNSDGLEIAIQKLCCHLVHTAKISSMSKKEESSVKKSKILLLIILCYNK